MRCAIILTMISASSLESRLRDVHEFRIRRARAKSVSKKSGIESGLIGIFAILQPHLIYHGLNGARYAFETPKEGFSDAKCIPYTCENWLAGKSHVCLKSLRAGTANTDTFAPADVLSL